MKAFVGGCLVALAACTNQVGTIDLDLTTAPGSTLLDALQRLRVTITDPLVVVEADRTDGGFDLALEIEATGSAATVIVEGFDSSNALLATGSSPPFGLSAVNARIVVYMAPPLTIGSAPTRLPAARTGVASTKLSYGFALAGGADADDTQTDAIFIYNAFDHSLLAGLAMPAPRAFQAMGTATNDAVLLFGGEGSDGAPTGSLWRYDTTVAPSGSYQILEEHGELARSDATMLELASELHLITGTPPIDVTFNAPVARTDVASVGRYGGRIDDVVVLGGDPAIQLRDGVFTPLGFSVDPTDSATTVGNTVVFASGRGDTELAVVGADGIPAFLDVMSTVRRDPAIAATDRFIVIAGGRDAADQPIATADIFAIDFTPIATIDCFARSGATAHALPNGQIAIVGGEPANDLIELFTPPPP